MPYNERKPVVVTSSTSPPDDILTLAQQRTGLRTLDSDSWREGLAIVLEEADSPTVTPAGKATIIERSVQALSARLRVNSYVESHPEVREEKVDRPLVILCMPRTGTTVASYLLSQDPARRSLLH